MEKSPTQLKIKRLWVWGVRESLRIQGFIEFNPILLIFLYATIFGFFTGLGTKIFTQGIAQPVIAGMLAFFLNGIALGWAFLSAKDPWEAQEKIHALNIQITSAIAWQNTLKENKRLQQEKLRREKEEQWLEEERLRRALAQEQKALVEEQKRQAQEQEALQRAILKERFSNQSDHGHACWYCSQTLLPGWIQCVFCKMIS